MKRATERKKFPPIQTLGKGVRVKKQASELGGRKKDKESATKGSRKRKRGQKGGVRNDDPGGRKKTSLDEEK